MSDWRRLWVLMLEICFGFAFKSVIYVFNAIGHGLRILGSAHWPCVNATVTAPPTSMIVLGCPCVEIVYSYRFEGALQRHAHRILMCWPIRWQTT